MRGFDPRLPLSTVNLLLTMELSTSSTHKTSSVETGAVNPDPLKHYEADSICSGFSVAQHGQWMPWSALRVP